MGSQVEQHHLVIQKKKNRKEKHAKTAANQNSFAITSNQSICLLYTATAGDTTNMNEFARRQCVIHCSVTAADALVLHDLVLFTYGALNVGVIRIAGLF